jgi:exodeoxyribonuclease VII large subunit
MNQNGVKTVSELTSQIKGMLENQFTALKISGELSNVKSYPSGHIYFTLKDEAAQISAVLFRSSASRLRIELVNGLAVICHGGVSVYPPRGNYQLVVTAIEPCGLGNLHAAFEALKNRLMKEGLFSAETKQKLPFLPERIGIVTSPSGAAFEDITRAIFARFPSASVILFPSQVQGEKAASEISTMIGEVNRLNLADVLIVGRGGGSMEDLWAFNEEMVARAIFTSRIPIISAVGHEIDFTISDFVADARAPTPSVAGEMVIPQMLDLKNRLAESLEKMNLFVLNKLLFRREHLNHLQKRLKSPESLIADSYLKCDDLSEKLKYFILQRYNECRLTWSHLADQLESLNPLRVLARGFSVVQKVSSCEVVLESGQVAIHEPLKVILHRGSLICDTQEIFPPKEEMKK